MNLDSMCVLKLGLNDGEVEDFDLIPRYVESLPLLTKTGGSKSVGP